MAAAKDRAKTSEAAEQAAGREDPAPLRPEVRETLAAARVERERRRAERRQSRQAARQAAPDAPAGTGKTDAEDADAPPRRRRVKPGLPARRQGAEGEQGRKDRPGKARTEGGTPGRPGRAEAAPPASAKDAEDATVSAETTPAAKPDRKRPAAPAGRKLARAEHPPPPITRPRAKAPARPEHAPERARPAERVHPVERPGFRARGPVSGERSRWPLVISFILIVLLPGAYGVHYLFFRAVDRYHSIVAFSVRSEEQSSAIPDLPIALPGATGAIDSDIVDEFLRSQQLVEKLDRDLDLRKIYNRNPEDWVFSLGDDATIEDLVDYWSYMVDIDYDKATQLITVTAYAFTREDAQAITRGILRETTALINSLSDQAREDAIAYARQDLQEAEARLKEVRLQLRRFRDKAQTVDPTKDIEIQMGLIAALQQALAEELVRKEEYIASAARPNPTIVAQHDRKIAAIRAQIEDEKAKLGSGGTAAGGELAEEIGTYEELQTELGFAEQAYTLAKGQFDQARIDARRKTRYLAAHIQPTLAESSQYPQRYTMSAILIGLLFFAWGMFSLILYNVRDRR
ncbi:MAG: sugar transporter [Alphaproteobacteria bacterium]|nr:MAG: sugar transporter [Alphaproteobacteria bacterium]